MSGEQSGQKLLLAPRGPLGRADLLHALQNSQALNWLSLDGQSLGYWREPPSLPPPLGNKAGGSNKQPLSRPLGEQGYRAPLRAPEFWAVEEEPPVGQAGPIHQHSALQNMASDLETLVPLLNRPSVTPEDEAGLLAQTLPPLPWVQQKAGLQRVFKRYAAHRARVDWRALAQRLARAQPLWPLPLQRLNPLPASLVLVVDQRPMSMSPCVEWMPTLVERMQRWLGQRAVVVRYPLLDPGQGYQERTGQQLHTQVWRPMPAGWVLVFSDLGVSSHASLAERDAYQNWLNRLAQGGGRLLVLSPALGSGGALVHGVPSVQRCLGLLSWGGRSVSATSIGCEPWAAAIVDVLALMVLTGPVSDTLLLALTRLCVSAEQALPLAWAVWNHPDVKHARRRVWVADESEKVHRQHLTALAPELLWQAHQLRQRFQAGMPVWDECLATLRLAALAPVLLPRLGQALAAAQQLLFVQLPHAVQAQEDGATLAAQQALRIAHALVRQADVQGFRLLQQQAFAVALRAGEAVSVYPELGPVDELSLHGYREADGRGWQLIQQGNRLVLRRGGGRAGAVLAAGLAPTGRGVTVTTQGGSRWLALSGSEVEVLSLEGVQGARVQLDVGGAGLGLVCLARPGWAVAAWRDSKGLWVQAPLPWGATPPLPWQTGPSAKGTVDFSAALQKTWQSYFDMALLVIGRGTGARRLEADEYGLFLDFGVKGVFQRFRWIEPGSFLMGSPKTEPERFNNEGPQHRVTLTQGFWLADTVCTQALWLAVVGGKNPSRVTLNSELPVEQVSWDDVMKKFMPKLQALLPEGVEATLPSEAQWEYACRAGTSTAYFWGDEVSPELANIGAGKTTPVKTYPANPWGLFDMHGNVFEWCFDGLRPYAEGETVDPLGAVGDGSRALRGGSWFRSARIARSAFRRAYDRDDRWHDCGFRLALRFKPSQGAQPQGIGAGGPGVQRPEASQAEPGAWRRGGATTPAPAEPKPDGREAAAQKNGLFELLAKAGKKFKGKR